jgi:hypothetical protein
VFDKLIYTHQIQNTCGKIEHRQHNIVIDSGLREQSIFKLFSLIDKHWYCNL